MTIETPRLIIRDWVEEDLDPFVRHTNTPAVMRWLGGVQDPEELKARWRERVMVWQETRGFTFWAVERKADGDLLGFCGLKLIDAPGSGAIEGVHEIGWRLREDAWGHGYAKEAASACLDFAFETLGAPRVVAITVPGNSASWGLMRRLGLRRREDLDYEDPRFGPGLNPTIVYEIEARAWLERR
ncbi:MAG: GNAT family N-acetyltransferase [Alphaproteobacteria bacterium]|nr:GNAT family N-acetyltransferase [Alphaproteobacteria bacterium]